MDILKYFLMAVQHVSETSLMEVLCYGLVKEWVHCTGRKLLLATV